MAEVKGPEYVLTVVQHTYCSDCMWIKGKITDVYHASGIVRGDDSRHWRMHILSPPWDREERRSDFPDGFSSIDVPALKLEVDRRIILATNNAGLISEILVELKMMLLNRQSNSRIREKLSDLVAHWKDSPGKAACLVTTT